MATNFFSAGQTDALEICELLSGAIQVEFGEEIATGWRCPQWLMNRKWQYCALVSVYSSAQAAGAAQTFVAEELGSSSEFEVFGGISAVSTGRESSLVSNQTCGIRVLQQHTISSADSAFPPVRGAVVPAPIALNPPPLAHAVPAS